MHFLNKSAYYPLLEITSSLRWVLPASERRPGSYFLPEFSGTLSICPTSRSEWWRSRTKRRKRNRSHESQFTQPCLTNLHGFVSGLHACRCPAAACPAWLKSNEKTIANRDDASLCLELTQPKDFRIVNIAWTRSTSERNSNNHSREVWKAEENKLKQTFQQNEPTGSLKTGHPLLHRRFYFSGQTKNNPSSADFKITWMRVTHDISHIVIVIVYLTKHYLHLTI